MPHVDFGQVGRIDDYRLAAHAPVSVAMCGDPAAAQWQACRTTVTTAQEVLP